MVSPDMLACSLTCFWTLSPSTICTLQTNVHWWLSDSNCLGLLTTITIRSTFVKPKLFSILKYRGNKGQHFCTINTLLPEQLGKVNGEQELICRSSPAELLHYTIAKDFFFFIK